MRAGVHVYVLNCGSSSVKYALLDADAGTTLAAGIAERIGQAASRVVHDGKPVLERPLPDHAAALGAIFEICRPAGLVAVAHRVVHGGERFRAPVVIDDAVLAAVRELAVLAPLHNPV